MAAAAATAFEPDLPRFSSGRTLACFLRSLDESTRTGDAASKEGGAVASAL